VNYTVTLTAEDYNAEVDLWVVKWKIPYNASIGTYNFTIQANSVEDIYGNIGPENATSPSGSFTVERATITVENFKTDMDVYETGEVATVTFDAFYPSGDKVTTGNVTLTFEGYGAGSFNVNASYNAGVGKWYATFSIQDDWIGPYNVTISANSLNDTATPPNSGPSAAIKASFDVAQIRVIEIIVDVGSSYFPGETANFYAAARLRGAPYDLPATALSAEVHAPDGAVTELTATKVAAGVYKFSYVFPADAPAGGYVAVVKAYYEVAPYTYARGFGIVSFSVSPTLTEWNAWLTEIKNGVAVINTTIGEVKLSLDDLNATIISIKDGIVTLNTTLGEVKAEVEALDLSAIEGKLVSIENGIAYINTTLGEIEVKLDALDLSAIDAKLTAINGTVATISSDIGDVQTSLDEIVESIESVGGDVVQIKTKVGTIEGKVTSIDGNVATISTDIGKIKTDVSNIKDLASDASTYSKDAKSSADEAKEAAESAKSSAESLIVPIWVAVILALVAAIAAIASVVIIQRKIAG